MIGDRAQAKIDAGRLDLVCGDGHARPDVSGGDEILESLRRKHSCSAGISRSPQKLREQCEGVSTHWLGVLSSGEAWLSLRTQARDISSSSPDYRTHHPISFRCQSLCLPES